MTQPCPKCSIIVPAYNAGEWLDASLDSLSAQTFADFEVIVIDDGSTDDTLAVARRHAEADPRIKVVTGENGGVSQARNKGMALAHGEWIGFVDADDYVDSDYLAILTARLGENAETDLSTSGLTYFYADGREECEYPPSGFYDLSTPDGLLGVAAQTLITSPVLKLYRRSIIELNALRFDPSLSYGEDRDFNVRFLLHCRKAVSSDRCAYHYRRDLAGSLSALRRGNIFATDLDYWRKLHTLFIERNAVSLEADRYLVNRLFNFVNDHLSVAPLTPETSLLLRNGIDRKFLRANSSLIVANQLNKFLIVNGQYRLLKFIISLRR